MKTNLTVITVAANEKGLLDYMIESVMKYSPYPPNFIICDNGGNGKRLEKYNKWSNIEIVKNYEKRKSLNTSVKHGSGLNKIFPMVKTKYTALIEPDVIILSNQWFKCDFSKYKMMAAVKGGRDTHPYYYVFFMVFLTGALRPRGAIVDWMANPKTWKMGIPKYKGSNQLYCDTGWRLYERIELKDVCELKLLPCASKKTTYFGPQFQHKSCEVLRDNEPIAAHFWRGSDVGRKSRPGIVLSAAEQLRQWKKICKKIIS